MSKHTFNVFQSKNRWKNEFYNYRYIICFKPPPLQNCNGYKERFITQYTNVLVNIFEKYSYLELHWYIFLNDYLKASNFLNSWQNNNWNKLVQIFVFEFIKRFWLNLSALLANGQFYGKCYSGERRGPCGVILLI